MVMSWVLRVSHKSQVLKNLINGPMSKVAREAGGASAWPLQHEYVPPKPAWPPSPLIVQNCIFEAQ